MKNRVDFIHVGYHKTATTWFQLYGYSTHPDINLLNQGELDSVFFDTFAQPDDFCFEENDYQKKFIDRVDNKIDDKIVNGICEENLSGHSWTGRNADTVLRRIYSYYKDGKIILSIRNQESMLRSLYSNYVKNGGTLSFKKLLKDISFEGDLVEKKLEYHRLINSYYDAFGKENVFVYLFEEFQRAPDDVLSKLASFLGVSPFVASPKDNRVNKGFGRYQLITERFLNTLSIQNRYSRKLVEMVFKIDRPIHLSIPEHLLEQWSLSNEETAKLTGLDLQKYGYLMEKK